MKKTPARLRFRLGRRSWLVLLPLGFFAAAPEAPAFWPTSLRTSVYPGGNAVSHERMTVNAIVGDAATISSSLDNEFFGATSANRNLLEAAKEIADANAETDEDQSPYLHFDAEHFQEARFHVQWMVSAVVQELDHSDVHAPRRMLGRGLHTLQDFFAHSNWIELNGNTAVTCPALIYPYTTPFSPGPVGPLIPVCGIHVLTSGYYGDSGAPPILEKYIHGGVTDDLAGNGTNYCEWLNKDSDHSGVFGAGAWTHAPTLHPIAASAAEMATKEYIRGIRAALIEKYGAEDGNKKLRKLLGADINVRLSNDNLRSAVDFLVTLDGRELQTIVNLLSKRTAEIFLPDLSGATSHEMVVKATASESVTGIAGYTLVLPPQYQFDSVESDLDVGSPVAISGQTNSGSFIIKPLGGRPHRQDKYRFSRSPAPFRLTPSAGPSQVDSVDILSVRDSAVGASKLYFVPVDGTLTDLAVSLNGTNTLSLKRPDGTIVQAADPGVFLQNEAARQLVSVAAPVAGKWTVLVSEGAAFELQVSGRSPLGLRNFNFLKLGGRPGHEGFFKLRGDPIAGQTNTVRAELGAGFTTAQFELRSPDAKLLQALVMDASPSGPTNLFGGAALLPSEPFVAYVTGKDTLGKTYQRVQAGEVVAQKVYLDAPPLPELLPGKTTLLNLKITNVGERDDFTVSASGDRGYVKSITPTNVTLELGQSQNVVVEIQPPSTETPGTPITIRLTGQSSNHPESRNKTVLVGAVLEPPPSNDVLLTLERAGSDYLLYWTGDGILQTTEALGSAWQDLNGEESPYLIPVNANQKFYRVMQK